VFAKYILYIFLDINVRRRAVIIFMPNSPVDCHCGWTLIVESYISVYCYSGHIQSHIIFQSISFCIDFCRQQQQKPGQRTPEKLNLCFGPKNMPHVACAIENSWFSSNPLTRSTRLQEHNHIWPVNPAWMPWLSTFWPALFQLNTPRGQRDGVIEGGNRNVFGTSLSQLKHKSIEGQSASN